MLLGTACTELEGNAHELVVRVDQVALCVPAASDGCTVGEELARAVRRVVVFPAEAEDADKRARRVGCGTKIAVIVLGTHIADFLFRGRSTTLALGGRTRRGSTRRLRVEKEVSDRRGRRPNSVEERKGEGLMMGRGRELRGRSGLSYTLRGKDNRVSLDGQMKWQAPIGPKRGTGASKESTT